MAQAHDTRIENKKSISAVIRRQYAHLSAQRIYVNASAGGMRHLQPVIHKIVGDGQSPL
jgi:hypothetical protein